MQEDIANDQISMKEYIEPVYGWPNKVECNTKNYNKVE